MAPIVTTVSAPVPHTGKPAIGPVASTRRLSGWSHATLPLPPRVAVSLYRMVAPSSAPPRYSRISAGDHGSAQHLVFERSTRRSLPAYAPDNWSVADVASRSGNAGVI